MQRTETVGPMSVSRLRLFLERLLNTKLRDKEFLLKARPRNVRTGLTVFCLLRLLKRNSSSIKF